MEDDAEVLDWGHEDELVVAAHGSEQRSFDVDDAEDAVSLGGDEEDEFLTYQARVPQHPHSPQKSARHQKQDSSSLSPSEHTATDDRAPSLPRSHTFGTLVHALPPKPVVATVSFVHPPNSSIIEATAMASRIDRDKRNGTPQKPSVYDHNDPLPAGWELKHPRNGRGVYYYNIHTQESTWIRPTTPSIREMRGDRPDRRDDLLDIPLPSRNGETLIPRVGRADTSDMSYDDRHYRPAESARRDDRPARSSQRVDSYVPDSYSPDHRNSLPLSLSPRARDGNSTPPPRRPSSPDDPYGDRGGVQRSHREAHAAVASSQDRSRAALDGVPHERTRERRQRNDPPLPRTDRRNPPRDTERSSTTRLRSPASYPRSSQESVNTTPRSSLKPLQPFSEAPAAGRKSRFSQADPPVHPSRHSESHDVGMRRARTDDLSHSTRHADDLPSSRSMSDVRGDDDIPTHLASDAQRSGPRKRTPLPPRDETYLPGPRLPSAQRDFLGPAGPLPVSVPESRRIGRTVVDGTQRDLARRSPSPRPRPPPSERDDPDRGRPRWSKPQSNGPLQIDSHNTHESSRARAHDVSMDVDDAPLPRSSEPPAKQIPPRRPALQDDVPRYPRAMLNADHDGASRSVRESRDGVDSRHRSVVDIASRVGSSRDRPGTERHSVEQAISQKETNRGIETRPAPVGSNVKLSGTNNIPIGAKNKFSSNAPPTAPSGVTHRPPPIMTGSNGEPVGPRRDRLNRDHERPPLLDSAGGDRSAPTEPIRREDTRQSSPDVLRPLPPGEPAMSLTRPSRAALGMSRFGPPIVKENSDPARSQANVSSGSIGSEHARATPPPISRDSRESSMTSFKDLAVPPVRPSHLPPRPASPPRGYQVREVAKPTQHPIPNAEAPVHLRVSSPTPRKRAMDTYPSDPPPVPRDRATYSPERPRPNVRDAELDPQISRPPPPVVRVEQRERAPPAMHPERALMLQANGLPPRPPPSVVGAARSGRGFKRDRRDERDHERAEPLRGNDKSGGFGSTSPVGERRRPAEDDRPVGYGGGGGASLLDRLTLDDRDRIHSPSLRERVQIPSKRDREDMLTGDPPFEVETEEHDGTKRIRRRGGPRVRKGRV